MILEKTAPSEHFWQHVQLESLEALVTVVSPTQGYDEIHTKQIRVWQHMGKTMLGPQPTGSTARRKHLQEKNDKTQLPKLTVKLGISARA